MKRRMFSNDLHPDILYEIIRHLDYATTISLLQTCKTYSSIRVTQRIKSQLISKKRLKLLSLSKQNTKNAVYKCCHLGDIDLLDYMYSKGDLNSCRVSKCVRIVCYKGHAKILKFLIGTNDRFTYDLSSAFEFEHLDCITVILENINFKEEDIHYFLEICIFHNRPKAFKLILSDERIKNVAISSSANHLFSCMERDRFECYKILMEHLGSPPIFTTLSFYTIKWLALNWHTIDKIWKSAPDVWDVSFMIFILMIIGIWIYASFTELIK